MIVSAIINDGVDDVGHREEPLGSIDHELVVPLNTATPRLLARASNRLQRHEPLVVHGNDLIAIWS